MPTVEEVNGAGSGANEETSSQTPPQPQGAVAKIIVSSEVSFLFCAFMAL